MTMRQCLKCESIKPRDSFYGKKWAQSYCKPCQNKFAKDWRDANQQHLKEYKKTKWLTTPDRDKTNKRLKARYGITLEQYEAKLDAQVGTCAICNSKPEAKRLGVDHCHSTGNVRALLCDRCNTLIGRVKDVPELLDSAAAYLRFWGAK